MIFNYLVNSNIEFIEVFLRSWPSRFVDSEVFKFTSDEVNRNVQRLLGLNNEPYSIYSHYNNIIGCNMIRSKIGAGFCIIFLLLSKIEFPLASLYQSQHTSLAIGSF